MSRRNVARFGPETGAARTAVATGSCGRPGGAGGGRKRRKSGTLALGPGLAVVAADGDAGDNGALLLGIDGRRDVVERPRHEGRPAARRLVDAARRPRSVPGVTA